MDKFEVSDWVKVKYTNQIGFIIFKHDSAGYKIDLGENGKKFFESKHLESYNDVIVDETFIHNLQLLAISVGDKKWFEELSERRNSLEKV